MRSQFYLLIVLPFEFRDFLHDFAQIGEASFEQIAAELLFFLLLEGNGIL